MTRSIYSSLAGVKSAKEMPGFQLLLSQLAPTFDFAPDARPKIGFGYYANVIPVTPQLGVAISTDGVGTKILIAQALEKYNTIGIDCVAMNVNDVICVGARPLSMVDYLAVEAPDEKLLKELGEGLAEGAKQAGISIAGGELAQVREMIQKPDKGIGFDLVGTCIGVVPLKDILTGDLIEPGQTVIGFGSSGIHSNGLTLAREILGDLYEEGEGLDGTVGEELLKPTFIYVKLVSALRAAGVEVSALAHITSDGFLNLSRVNNRDISFELVSLPKPHPIFEIIRERGQVSPEDMFLTFNMGVGFVAVVAKKDAPKAIAIGADAGCPGYDIGSVSSEPGKRVYLREHGLVGDEELGCFVRY